MYARVLLTVGCAKVRDWLHTIFMNGCKYQIEFISRISFFPPQHHANTYVSLRPSSISQRRVRWTPILYFQTEKCVGAVHEPILRKIRAIGKHLAEIRKEVESTSPPLPLLKIAQITLELNKISVLIELYRLCLNQLGTTYIFISKNAARDYDILFFDNPNARSTLNESVNHWLWRSENTRNHRGKRTNTIYFAQISSNRRALINFINFIVSLHLSTPRVKVNSQ